MKRSTALAGALAASAMSAFPAGAGAQDASISVSTTPVDSSAEPYFAIDAGLYKSSGLNVELVPAQNGAAIAAAVASGSVDIGNGNLVSVALAHARKIPFVLIAPGGLYSAKTPSTIAFGPKSTTVKSGRDLTGKTVAVNTLRGLPQFGMQAWIDKTGGSSESVKFIELTSSAILVALAQNRIDAAALVEPFVTPGHQAGKMIAAPFDAIAPAFLITAHFTTLEWARTHPDLVRRFQDSVKKTAAWANKNHERSGEILVKYAKLGGDTLHAMRRTVFAEELDVVQIQPVIDLTAKYGGITSFPAIELLPHRA